MDRNSGPVRERSGSRIRRGLPRRVLEILAQPVDHIQGFQGGEGEPYFHLFNGILCGVRLEPHIYTIPEINIDIKKT